MLLGVGTQVTCQRSHKEAGSSLNHISLIRLAPENHFQLVLLEC